MRMFDRLDRIVNRQADSMFAVRFILLPVLATPNGRGKRDPQRQIFAGKGILDAEHTDVQVEAQRTDKGNRAFNATIGGNNLELSVDSRRYPELEIDDVRQGDIVELPDDGRRFRVTAVKDDDFGRLVLKLTKA